MIRSSSISTPCSPRRKRRARKPTLREPDERRVDHRAPEGPISRNRSPSRLFLKSVIERLRRSARACNSNSRFTPAIDLRQIDHEPEAYCDKLLSCQLCSSWPTGIRPCALGSACSRPSPSLIAVSAPVAAQQPDGRSRTQTYRVRGSETGQPGAAADADAEHWTAGAAIGRLDRGGELGHRPRHRTGVRHPPHRASAFHPGDGAAAAPRCGRRSGHLHCGCDPRRSLQTPRTCTGRFYQRHHGRGAPDRGTDPRRSQRQGIARRARRVQHDGSTGPSGHHRRPPAC